jgi:tripartite-type tricarboxylate transporter receptor subunit TctC
MPVMGRRPPGFGFFAVILALAGAALSVSAQQFPSRSVRLIIPFAAGGAPDFMARPVAAQVEAQIGQSVVVENRAGANGIIGMQAVANAEPDGHTLLHVVPAFVINRSVYKKLPFDIFDDFAPVATIGIGTGYLLIVHPKLPVHSVADLIAHAKKERVLYGSAGIGNTLHLTAELFNVSAGISMEHVPFRGAGPVLTAILSGTVQAGFFAPAAVVEQVKSGALRAIGFTGSTPLRELPDVPLIGKTLPDFKIEGAWHAWLAPGKTPSSIVTQINAEVSKALKVERVRNSIEQAGYFTLDKSPKEFAAFLREEADRYARAVAAAKIPLQ